MQKNPGYMRSWVETTPATQCPSRDMQVRGLSVHLGGCCNTHISDPENTSHLHRDLSSMQPGQIRDNEIDDKTVSNSPRIV